MAVTLNNGSFDAPAVYKDKAVRNTVVCIKASPMELTGWRISNPNSTVAVLKFFDAAATTDVTLGTTEAVKEFQIPSQGEIHVGHLRGSSLFYFAYGCCMAATTSLETSATGSPILSLDVEIYYQK
jgi:hypothetical protein